jgi:hypothetical protein
MSYTKKGYTQNTRMQKPKQALKKEKPKTKKKLQTNLKPKKKILKCVNDGKPSHYNNATTMASLTHHPKGKLKFTPTTPLISVLHCTCFLINGAITFLCTFHAFL